MLAVSYYACPSQPDMRSCQCAVSAQHRPAGPQNTGARLGRVTPLGQPWSVYKSDVECRFLSRNGQMTLKVKVNDFHFQYYLSLDAYLVILAQICEELSNGQAKFPRILSQNGHTDLEGQGQWLPFSITAEIIPGCMFGANLVILARICDELSHGQAEFPRILSQNGQNDLEGQGQWPPFSITVESIPGCMFGANLVNPAQICDELSCGQAKVYGHLWRIWSQLPWSKLHRILASSFLSSSYRVIVSVDNRTDERTEAGNDNTPSAWKAKG